MPIHAPYLRTGGYMRNFVFGVEDSLVSTVGLLSGVAIAAVPPKTIFLTGIVLIFVEAFSMAVGSFLSESSTEEYVAGKETPLAASLAGAVVMFFSYFLSGFIPLFPYLAFPVTAAFWISITLSVIALFSLGLVGARLSRFSGQMAFRRGVRMCLIGGFAIAIGVTVGALVNRL